MPPLAIARIEYPSLGFDELKQYIQKRYKELLPSSERDNLIDEYVQPREGYLAVKAFITDASLEDKAEDVASVVHDELRASGYKTMFYVHTWSGIGMLPSD